VSDYISNIISFSCNAPSGAIFASLNMDLGLHDWLYLSFYGPINHQANKNQGIPLREKDPTSCRYGLLGTVNRS
ncbi:MAG: hypothetical protein KZQ86_12325, partial [Candidatus Thiodiazotropha sp. (ex Lucinoma kastoroae)]|nr:hypothetical protein [Candidatus Thiodiazotropha sp. (ex Lucinoma kastoroae)]